MLQTIVARPFPIDGQIWSLAIEWWLYMIAPLLRKLSTPIIFVITLCSLAVNITIKPPDASLLLHGKSLLCLAWYWLIGFMYYRHRCTAYGLNILLIPITVGLYSHIFMGNALMIGLFAIIMCSYIRIKEPLIPLMKWLGDVSYPLYCIHLPIVALCVFWHVYSSALITFIVFAISIIVLQLLDFPMRRWVRSKYEMI